VLLGPAYLFGFPGLYARTIELYTCRVYARASGCQDERQFRSRRLWGSRKMLSRDQAFIQSQQVDRVGPLTVGVAHDLNNLLAIIAGNLETLEQRIGNKNPMRRQVQVAPHAVHPGSTQPTRRILLRRLPGRGTTVHSPSANRPHLQE